MTSDDMPELADLFARAWHDRTDLAAIGTDVTTFRRRFTHLRFCRT